jgi:hypothetical protein
LTAENGVVADSEIDTKNCVAADLEIGSDGGAIFFL